MMVDFLFVLGDAEARLKQPPALMHPGRRHPVIMHTGKRRFELIDARKYKMNHYPGKPKFE
jgi:hypothetical protein